MKTEWKNEVEKMKAKTYQGETLREISFPLGGIGSGCIGLDGYGRLIDREIFVPCLSQ